MKKKMIANESIILDSLKVGAETTEELLDFLAPLKAQMNQERRLINTLSGANVERWRKKR